MTSTSNNTVAALRLVSTIMAGNDTLGDLLVTTNLCVPEIRFGLLTCGFKSNLCPLIIRRQSSRGHRGGLPRQHAVGTPDYGRTGDSTLEAPGI